MRKPYPAGTSAREQLKLPATHLYRSTDTTGPLHLFAGLKVNRSTSTALEPGSGLADRRAPR